MDSNEEQNREGRDSQEFDTIVRYSRLQAQEKEGFFDVEEFSAIISHFIGRLEISKAQIALQQGLSQHPGSLALSLDRAYLNLCNGQADTCIKILGSLELVHPNNEDIICMKADAYGQRGEAIKGIRILERQLANSSQQDVNRLHHQLAELYMLEGRHLDAIAHWKNLIANVGARPDALVALLENFKDAEIVEEGIRYFSAITETEPYNALAWIQLAECYASLDQYSEAISAYDYALAIDEKNHIALYNKADCQFQEKNLTGALSTYHELNRLSPQEATVLCGMAECLEQLGEHLSALTHFQQALAADAHHSDARMGMAICHNHLGARDVALKEMETVVALQPDNGAYWYVYAELLSTSGDQVRGQLAYERAIQLSDSAPEYIYGQLDALISSSACQVALEKVQVAFELLGDVAELYYRGIKSLHLLGKKDEALTLLEMLIERHAQFKAMSEYYPEIFEEPEAFNLLNFS